MANFSSDEEDESNKTPNKTTSFEPLSFHDVIKQNKSIKSCTFNCQDIINRLPKRVRSEPQIIVLRDTEKRCYKKYSMGHNKVNQNTASGGWTLQEEELLEEIVMKSKTEREADGVYNIEWSLIAQAGSFKKTAEQCLNKYKNLTRNKPDKQLQPRTVLPKQVEHVVEQHHSNNTKSNNIMLDNGTSSTQQNDEIDTQNDWTKQEIDLLILFVIKYRSSKALKNSNTNINWQSVKQYSLFENREISEYRIKFMSLIKQYQSENATLYRNHSFMLRELVESFLAASKLESTWSKQEDVTLQQIVMLNTQNSDFTLESLKQISFWDNLSETNFRVNNNGVQCQFRYFEMFEGSGARGPRKCWK